MVATQRDIALHFALHGADALKIDDQRYFTFALPSTLAPTPLLPSTPASIVAGIVAAALFMGAATPLFYELGVEMTYP